jgi:hypothetical protein
VAALPDACYNMMLAELREWCLDSVVSAQLEDMIVPAHRKL